MLLWNVLFIISIVLLVAIIVILIIFNFIKRRPFFDYYEDDLIKEKESANSYDLLFFTHGDTRNYITKYVLCQGATDKFVICNYIKQFKNINFFVVCYNKKKKMTAIYSYKENNVKSNFSKIIPVKKNTASVNIIIGKVDGVVINYDVTRPVPKWKINLFSALTSLGIFLLLFIMRHIIANAICKEAFFPYLYSVYNYIAIIASGCIALLAFLFMIIAINHRNAKRINGGVIEYEFI